MSMQATSVVLSVPHVGSFDEESCRYFLREIGEQIVPFYPFTFGIDEVYMQLLQRYGENWVADAISVLQDLMEAENNANGLGDDGDIWRSWRHSWRHRNDDPSKPFTPAVRGLTLPPPTSQTTRQARAASFSACIAAPIEASDVHQARARNTLESEPKGHGPRSQHTFPNEDEASVGRTVRFLGSPGLQTPERVRCRLSQGRAPQGNSAICSDKEDADSQQDFEEVQNFADSIDFDNSQLISFEMLTPPSGLRGRDMEICTLRPVRTTQTREESPLSIKHQQRISQSTSCQVSNLTTAACSPMIRDPFSSPDRSWSMILPKTVFKADAAVGTGATTQTGLSLPLIAAEPTGATSPTISCRTVANRHARLIDGAIFTVKHHSFVDPGSRHGDSFDDGQARRSVVRARWPAVRQKEPFRRSLIQGVRGIFRKDQQPQPPPPPQQQPTTDQKKGHRRTSSLLHNALDRGCDMLSPRRKVANPTQDPAITPHVRPRSWGLDGTFDEELGLPRPCLSLNKALPASPSIPRIRKSSSSRTATLSSDQSQGTPIRPSTASSLSSGISTASSKRDFRSLARGLIIEDMGAHRPDLSPLPEAETLSPRKYDPRESMPSSVYSENSYQGTRSPKSLNFFIENPVALTPGIPLPLSVRKRDDVMLPEISKTSPSQSPDKRRVWREDIDHRSPALPRYNTTNAQAVKLESTTAERGRTPRRPYSPGHAAQEYTENPPHKRSRSPVKKFFGQFGKSTSLKNIAGEPRAKSKSSSPEKRTTTPLKSWGNRFRHGFLTLDGETEEELNHAVTPPRTAMPSTPHSSTFPISLDPPYQAKILSEIELVICFNANNFLMEQWNAGRLSDESIAKTKHTWKDKNRPQVLEFMYDQVTQRDLIASNLPTIHFHGECSQNPLVLNATLYNWKILASEMAVRTFCSADSAIRKHMHDSHKIIEMLGAPPNTFLALQDLQLKTLSKINQKQRERINRYKEQEVRSERQTPSKQSGSVGRRVGTPAPVFGHTSKSNKGSVEVNPSPGFGEAFETFENSRGGRLGLMVRDMVKENDH